MQRKSPAQTLFLLVQRKPFPGKPAENENRTAFFNLPFPWEKEVDFNLVGLRNLHVSQMDKGGQIQISPAFFPVHSCHC